MPPALRGHLALEEIREPAGPHINLDATERDCVTVKC